MSQTPIQQPGGDMIRREWFRRTAGGAIGLAVAGGWPRTLLGGRPARAPLFVLRNPGCSCCVGWAEHLREAGFEVHLHDSPDLDAVKERLEIPSALHGCHTAVMEGYIVEGHVPAEFVQRLLDETPDVAGLAVPGMPLGSPGMEGPDPEPYDVIAFGAGAGADGYVFASVSHD